MAKEEVAAINYALDESGNHYGLERSEHGSNAFYFGDCEVAGQTVAYCVCLKKIAMNKQGKVYIGAQSCCDAIERNGCKADRMRRKESEAGHAMFYIDRARLNANCDERREEASSRMEALSAKKDASNLRRDTLGAPTETAPIVEALTEDGDYAAAINKAIRETVAEQPKRAVAPMPPLAQVEKKPAATPVPSLPTKGGMSLIEMARARMAAAAAAR